MVIHFSVGNLNPLGYVWGSGWFFFPQAKLDGRCVCKDQHVAQTVLL